MSMAIVHHVWQKSQATASGCQALRLAEAAGIGRHAAIAPRVALRLELPT
jgi:hypothetical protein